MFADMLDFSLEEYIEDYLEWEFKEQPDLNLECDCGAGAKAQKRRLQNIRPKAVPNARRRVFRAAVKKRRPQNGRP